MRKLGKLYEDEQVIAYNFGKSGNMIEHEFHLCL